MPRPLLDSHFHASGVSSASGNRKNHCTRVLFVLGHTDFPFDVGPTIVVHESDSAMVTLGRVRPVKRCQSFDETTECGVIDAADVVAPKPWTPAVLPIRRFSGRDSRIDEQARMGRRELK